jgi:hypothetical protein
VAAAMGTGVRRVVNAVGTSYRWWILAVATLTLDSTLAAGSRTMGAATTLRTSRESTCIKPRAAGGSGQV